MMFGLGCVFATIFGIWNLFAFAFALKEGPTANPAAELWSDTKAEVAASRVQLTVLGQWTILPLWVLFMLLLTPGMLAGMFAARRPSWSTVRRLFWKEGY